MAHKQRPERSPWKDPNVLEAVQAGRDESDISVIECPSCSTWSYYNDGQHFSCRGCAYAASGHKLDLLIEEGAVQTLADWELDTEDYPPF